LLAEKLGLDGLLILSLTTVTSKKYVSLDKFDAVIVGPVDDNKDAEYKGRINSGSMNRARDGIYYSSAGFEVDEIPMLQIKRGEFVEH